MMKLEREIEIIELAEFISQEYSAHGFIDPEKIAKRKGISFSYGDYKEAFDGMLEYSNESFHIYINLNRSKYPSSGRSRFTFCHELGHYFLDEHRNALISGAEPHKSKIDFISNLKVEREADTFAANLLIPKKSVQEKIKKSKLSGNLIIKLANHFGSSITSTAIRILKLDLFPFLLIKSNNGKIIWSWVSNILVRQGLKFPVKEFNGIHSGSNTYTYSETKVESGTNITKGTTASAWFAWVREDSHQNLIMIEDLISLGEYGNLTLVYPDSY